MTLRQPHHDAILPAAEAARLRQVLAACSGLLTWAQANCGPQFTAAAQDAAEAAGFSRAPGALAGEVNLAIDRPGSGCGSEPRLICGFLRLDRVGDPELLNESRADSGPGPTIRE